MDTTAKHRIVYFVLKMAGQTLSDTHAQSCHELWLPPL